MRIAGSNLIIATAPVPGNLRVWSGILLLLLIPKLFAAETLKDLGVISRTNVVGWDDDNRYTTNLSTTADLQLIGYNIYVASTNDAILSRTNFQKIGMITTNQWPGTSMGFSGRFAIAITVVAKEAVTNVSALTLQTNIIESEFSEIGSIDLDRGLPVPPNNVQLFMVLQAMATNAIPPLQVPSSAPLSIYRSNLPPNPKGKEFDLSGR